MIPISCRGAVTLCSYSVGRIFPSLLIAWILAACAESAAPSVTAPLVSSPSSSLTEAAPTVRSAREAALLARREFGGQYPGAAIVEMVTLDLQADGRAGD